MLIAGVIMIVTGSALGVIMTVIAVKVYRLTWQTDKIIPLMLILMCCTLYSSAIYFLMSDILYYSYDNFSNAFCTDPTPSWFSLMDGSLSVLPSYFLGVGCMLNLNKWIYF